MPERCASRVRPDLGGAVAGLWHGETPILRSTEPGGARHGARRRRCFRSCRTRTGSATGAFAGAAATTRRAPTSPTRRIRCMASAGSGRGGSFRRARSRSCSSSATGRCRLAVRLHRAPVLLAQRRLVRRPPAARRTTPTSSSRSASACIPTSSSARAAVSTSSSRIAGTPTPTLLPTRKVAQPGIDSDLAPRLRQLLRGLAGSGADPRRAFLAPADVVAALPRRLHAARARLLLRRAGQPCQQRDPYGRPCRARPGRARAGGDVRGLAEARHRRRRGEPHGRPRRHRHPRAARRGSGLAPQQQALWYCDIPARRINRFHPASGARAHWDFHCDVGSFAPTRDGASSSPCATASGASTRRSDARSQLAVAPYDMTEERFNDGKCDPAGRFWVGSIDEPRRPGRAGLWCFRDGVLERRQSGITISNGLAVECRRAHHVLGRHRGAHRLGVRLRAAQRRHDRPARVRAVRAEAGARVWPATAAGPTAPRSTPRAATGSRCTKAARVLRLSPAGELLAEVRVPARCPTMPCFGDADLKTVYVTSASSPGRPRSAPSIRARAAPSPSGSTCLACRWLRGA